MYWKIALLVFLEIQVHRVTQADHVVLAALVDRSRLLDLVVPLAPQILFAQEVLSRLVLPVRHQYPVFLVLLFHLSSKLVLH